MWMIVKFIENERKKTVWLLRLSRTNGALLRTDRTERTQQIRKHSHTHIRIVHEKKRECPTVH